MSFIMLFPKFFCCFIKLNLGCLSFRYFSFEFILFASDFNREFFDLEVQFFDLGFITSFIFLQCEGVFLLLSGSEDPLFEFLLVPVHFKLVLVHLLVSAENLILDVIQALLLFDHTKKLFVKEKIYIFCSFVNSF